MERDLDGGCPRCGSSDLTTIIVPVEGSLLSVAYCIACSLPNWRDAKRESLATIVAERDDAEG